MTTIMVIDRSGDLSRAHQYLVELRKKGVNVSSLVGNNTGKEGGDVALLDRQMQAAHKQHETAAKTPSTPARGKRNAAPRA